MNTVGYIKQVQGIVIAVQADGTERILSTGDPIYGHEVIRVSPDGYAEIAMNDGTELSLESEQSWLVSSETILSSRALDLNEAIATSQSIQTAILAGKDPTDIAESPAAGDDQNPVPLGNEGSSTVVIDRTATEVTPSAGYDTQGYEDPLSHLIDDTGDIALRAVLPGKPQPPGNAGNIALLLDEDAITDTDQGALNFRLGSDALSSMAFDNDLSSLTRNSDGLAGDEITWIRNSDNEIIGQIEGITAITLTLTPDLTSGSASVTAVLSDNFKHPDADGENRLDLGSIRVLATDIDGDSAQGEVSITVIDEIPSISISPVSLSIDSNKLDWSFAPWAPGQMSNSYNVSGTVFDFTITDPSDSLYAPLIPIPFTGRFYQGDQPNIDHSLIISSDLKILKTTDTVTIEFKVGASGVGVNDLRFKLFDVDGELGKFFRQEVYEINGSLNGTSVNPEITAKGTQVVSGNKVTGYDPISPTGANAIDGVVEINFDQAVDKVEIIFSIAPGSIVTTTSNPGFGIYDIQFQSSYMIDGAWNTEHEGNSSEIDTTIIFGGNRYNLDTDIDTGAGILRVSSDGTWNFTSSNQNPDVYFSIQATDIDGDTISTEFHIPGPLLAVDDQIISNQSSVEIPDWALLTNDIGLSTENPIISAINTPVGGSVNDNPDSITFTDSGMPGGTFKYTNQLGSLTDEADVSLTRVSGTLIKGSDRDGILIGGDAHEVLQGGSGKDILIGNGGDDQLTGGSGWDLLSGGEGEDLFIWNHSDNGTGSTPEVDAILDFQSSLKSGLINDRIDLSDLLTGESSSNITDYISIVSDGAHSRLDIKADGGSDITQQILLTDIDLTLGGTLSNSEIIERMVNNDNLTFDS